MAGPLLSSTREHAAERPASEGDRRVKNISTGLMRPLYTACSEHYYAQESSRVQSPADCSESGCESSAPSRLGLLISYLLPKSPEPPDIAQTASISSPFLRLPPELRLQIYSLLALPTQAHDLLASFEKVSASTQDYFDYNKKQHGAEKFVTPDLLHPTLRMRTVDPVRYSQRFPGNPRHHRSSYSVRADRFRARCMPTTYHCVNVPKLQHNLALMRVNRQIHAEAAELLYGSYTFDFDTHVEAILPFLTDLTPFARSCIKSMRIVKRALPYLNEFDKCEWHNALRYITSPRNDIKLRRLELGVVAGRPGERGWDSVSRFSSRDFSTSLQYAEGMEWVQHLLAITGLQELDVEAVIEHCPPCTSSSAMADYVQFSASVENGFHEFLKSQLLVDQAISQCRL